jgi:hypothetical protein
MSDAKPKLIDLETDKTAGEPEPEKVEGKLAIAKPGTFSLDKFKSKLDPTIASVETLHDSAAASQAGRRA